MQHKSHVGANLYVEDSEKHIREYRNTGSECIIFTNSTNRHLDGLRADNCREVQGIVLDRYARWKAAHTSRLSEQDNATVTRLIH